MSIGIVPVCYYRKGPFQAMEPLRLLCLERFGTSNAALPKVFRKGWDRLAQAEQPG